MGASRPVISPRPRRLLCVLCGKLRFIVAAKTKTKRRTRAALVTGFEPFGGHGLNPSAELARRIDGTTIGGTPVAGRILPVDIERIDRAIADVLREIDPVAVINLGLAAGEPVVRLERVALNLAAFEIPDNAGRLIEDRALEEAGAAALWTRLDLAGIRHALLAQGIPARLSSTAGTYLCNAAMYRFLRAVPGKVPCGFIHLPLLRAQVAEMLEQPGARDLAQCASMEFPTLLKALEIALEISLGASPRKPRTKA
jgi:pyroglutamyl-peptidase